MKAFAHELIAQTRAVNIQAVAGHYGAKRRKNGSCAPCGSNSIVSRWGRLCL
jgi:hypothetical protein